AYISYFDKGRVHNVPVLTAPFRVELLTSPDSILRPYTLEVKSVTRTKIELSNSDTLIQVNWREPFLLPEVGILQIERVTNILPKESYGFGIVPLRSISESFSSRLSVEVTNKNVSTIDLTLEHPLPKRGEQLLKTLIDKYVELN